MAQYQPTEDLIGRALDVEVRSRIANIIAEEAALVAGRVEKRLKEMADGIALSFLKQYEVTNQRDCIIIKVLHTDKAD